MRKKRLLAAATMTAALGLGGMAGFVLGAPGISSAQTDTTTPSTGAPATTAPTSGTPAPGANGTHPPHDCPNMGGSTGSAPGASTNQSGATNTGFHRGGGSYQAL